MASISELHVWLPGPTAMVGRMGTGPCRVSGLAWEDRARRFPLVMI